MTKSAKTYPGNVNFNHVVNIRHMAVGLRRANPRKRTLDGIVNNEPALDITRFWLRHHRNATRQLSGNVHVDCAGSLDVFAVKVHHRKVLGKHCRNPLISQAIVAVALSRQESSSMGASLTLLKRLRAAIGFVDDGNGVALQLLSGLVPVFESFVCVALALEVGCRRRGPEGAVALPEWRKFGVGADDGIAGRVVARLPIVSVGEMGHVWPHVLPVRPETVDVGVMHHAMKTGNMSASFPILAVRSQTLLRLGKNLQERIESRSSGSEKGLAASSIRVNPAMNLLHSNTVVSGLDKFRKAARINVGGILQNHHSVSLSQVMNVFFRKTHRVLTQISLTQTVITRLRIRLAPATAASNLAITGKRAIATLNGSLWKLVACQRVGYVGLSGAGTAGNIDRQLIRHRARRNIRVSSPVPEWHAERLCGCLVFFANALGVFFGNFHGNLDELLLRNG